ncbi:MAG: hypothetical protein ACKO14_05910 [Armatimonadota bacterium]
MECEIGSDQGQLEIHILDKAKCGLVAGQKMLIPTLADVEQALRALPGGTVTSEPEFRAQIAAPFGADGCCTFATNKVLRAIVEGAYAQHLDGVSQEVVLPFWRVVTVGSTIAKRMGLDASMFRSLLERDIQ